MSFRIAGIKILDKCEAFVRKKLIENRVYLFSSRYDVDKNDELILAIKRESAENYYAQCMYNIEREMGPALEVSICAIVGQNGDGKSSLIEVMLRVLNNFACTFGFLEDQPTLEYVDGVNAILYYEIDSKIYAIKCVGKRVTWYKNGVELILTGDDAHKKRSLRNHFMPDLFYTMIINYSLYAYTAASLGGHDNGDDYWIDGLFHKNDSYQTPIVLNPMRIGGNIDIIREGYLSKQRLMSIFANSSGEEEVRMISKNEIAMGYAFSLEKESKFIKKTLYNYFMDTFQDELVWGDLKGYEYSSEKIQNEFLDRFLVFWNSFRLELADNPKLVDVCSQILSSRKRLGKTDLRKYLILINNTGHPDKSTKNRRRDGGFGREFSMLVSSRKGSLYLLNYRQFYRLLLILLIWRALTESDKYGMFGARLNDALMDTRCPRNAAMLYLVYKFISIAEKYKGFCNAYYLTEEHFLPLINEWPNRDALGTIIHDLNQIMATNDYRTLKFKQTVNYLKQGKDYYDALPCNFPHIQYEYFLSFDDMNRQVLGVPLKEIQWRLPCPIFEGDIVLYDSKNYYPLETLSSGMIQRLNTVGSLIYHLRNLDDNQKGDRMIAYNQVCLVLEEVELYYHPEYQKSYINYLLEQISRASLSRITSLNLVFVTHSPFILSDITRNDILCLEEGAPVDLAIQTFGANIHDLLRLPFFMKNGTIGDYAQKVINEIIASLYVYDAMNKDENASFYKRHFKSVDPDVVECMNLLPLEDDGSIDVQDFKRRHSKERLKEAIDLLDEPIMKEALLQVFRRIFS